MMRRASSSLPPLFTALYAAVVAGACADRVSPRFPHRLHLTGLECGAPGKPACLSCTSCHSVADRERGHAFPEGELCVRCHRDGAHEILASLGGRAPRPSGRIAFDHARHLGMKEVGGQCVPCHAGVVDAERAELPSMSTCLSCHEHERQWQDVVCAPCHAQADLERTLPLTFMRHDQDFARRHGELARQEQRLCQSCHAQAQCDDCHDVTQRLAVERRRPELIEQSFVHRGDFLVRHAVEAESQPSRCLSCHTVETCDSCHVARGVSGNARGSRNPHPAGWVGSNPDASSFHGEEARRDIVACASCHEAGPATNCIRCHRVGGYGGNPHPNGWKSGQPESATMCRYCHE